MVSDYEETFAELAQAYQLAIVAGSAYVPDANGVVRHRTSVFGADGALLGRHDKIVLSPEDEALARPGDAWHVIDTPAGRGRHPARRRSAIPGSRTYPGVRGRRDLDHARRGR